MWCIHNVLKTVLYITENLVNILLVDAINPLFYILHVSFFISYSTITFINYVFLNYLYIVYLHNYLGKTGPSTFIFYLDGLHILFSVKIMFLLSTLDISRWFFNRLSKCHVDLITNFKFNYSGVIYCPQWKSLHVVCLLLSYSSKESCRQLLNIYEAH